MYIAILGRQPQLGAAELERLYGDVSWFSDETVTVKTAAVDLSRLGGSQKVGRVVAELPRGDWVVASRKLVAAYTEAWRDYGGKITLGISAYGFRLSPREVQKTGIILKKKLRETGVSLRLIPQDTPALSTATSHHNKLGLSDNKVELLVVRGQGGSVIIAESIGAQNITAYARRDQGRPKRDAFVGMLPPKLAQIIINLAVGPIEPRPDFDLLDPFCGTGVVVQEALLMGYNATGADISNKMVAYTSDNLNWLAQNYPKITELSRGVQLGDATKHTWTESVAIKDDTGEIVDAVLEPMRIGAVACETYLGQPFSAPPSPAKLREVRGNCNHIISTFLTNIAAQLQPGAPLCIAVPAWRGTDGSFTHLPLTSQLGTLGYKQIGLKTGRPESLLYYRDDQVVARELLVIQKI